MVLALFRDSALAIGFESRRKAGERISRDPSFFFELAVGFD
jgi:hypothetical protein